MTDYDVIIVGGGLAGLSLSILLSEKNYRIAVFEKEKYPFHKVCGEYVAMESWNFLERIGLKVSEMNLPHIDRLFISSESGDYFTEKLDAGGFGISRFLLDASLASIAKQKGVDVLEKSRVQEINFEDGNCSISTAQNRFSGRVAIGSFGKRSNIDKQWNRAFLSEEKNNWLGVKYHLSLSKKGSTIELHGFEDGYGGINAIEDNQSCLCYLVKADQLLRNHKDISELEKNLLSKNKWLHSYFDKRKDFVFQEPVTISNISFAIKEPVLNHTLMLGDAAGMVVPLFGNGMSMAFKSAWIAAPVIDDFLQKKISRSEMENHYSKSWSKNFSRRMKTGKLVQPFFSSSLLAAPTVKILKSIAPLRRSIIRASHGKPF